MKNNKTKFITIVCAEMFEIKRIGFPKKDKLILILLKLLLLEQIRTNKLS